MINWIRTKLNNRNRELPLVFVHQFKTGEKIFTYRQEDWGKVSSRYYRNIQEATNYLQTFALTKNEWEKAIFACKDIILSVMDASVESKNKALMDINSTFDYFVTKTTGLKNANETILELMYCMFYVLEDERETGYSEVNNKRKLELLNSEPEMRDFFLSSLKNVSQGLLPTTREDTLALLNMMERIKGQLEFLNTPGTGIQ